MSTPPPMTGLRLDLTASKSREITATPLDLGVTPVGRTARALGIKPTLLVPRNPVHPQSKWSHQLEITNIRKDAPILTTLVQFFRKSMEPYEVQHEGAVIYLWGTDKQMHMQADATVVTVMDLFEKFLAHDISEASVMQFMSAPIIDTWHPPIFCQSTGKQILSDEEGLGFPNPA